MDDLIVLLTELKELGAIGVKIAFEDEGALMNEVMTMRSLTNRSGMQLALKIGGCEAKRDITDAIHLNVDSIVAPMVESSFSLKKYLDAVGKYDTGNMKLGINIETITSYLALNDLKQHFDKLDFVTFGRVDFMGSCGKPRGEYSESIELRNKIEDVFVAAKSYKKACCLGGALATSSKDLVTYLTDKSLLDRIETRYIMYDMSKVDMDRFEYILYLANVFEVKWLNYVKNRYSSYAMKDSRRIDMIQDRVNANPFSDNDDLIK